MATSFSRAVFANALGFPQKKNHKRPDAKIQNSKIQIQISFPRRSRARWSPSAVGWRPSRPPGRGCSASWRRRRTGRPGRASQRPSRRSRTGRKLMHIFFLFFAKSRAVRFFFAKEGKLLRCHQSSPRFAAGSAVLPILRGRKGKREGENAEMQMTTPGPLINLPPYLNYALSRRPIPRAAPAQSFLSSGLLDPPPFPKIRIGFPSRQPLLNEHRPPPSSSLARAAAAAPHTHNTLYCSNTVVPRKKEGKREKGGERCSKKWEKGVSSVLLLPSFPSGTDRRPTFAPPLPLPLLFGQKTYLSIGALFLYTHVSYPVFPLN